MLLALGLLLMGNDDVRLHGRSRTLKSRQFSPTIFVGDIAHARVEI